MGKRAKDHRKKVEARNKRINQDKENIQKRQKEFIMDLIRKEKERGAFENTPNIPQNSVESLTEGPAI